jgi:transposase
VVETRRVGATSVVEGDEARTEVDNHADTCLVGRHAHIFQHFGRQVNITGYDPSLGTVSNQEIVSAALAYDDPSTGEVMILILHQAIHIPTLHHNLICPMQLRMNDIRLNECPKFLADDPTDHTHALTIPTKDEDYLIPLSIHGVTSYFPTRKPTIQEFEEGHRFELTYESPDWDPQDPALEEQEAAMTDRLGHVRPTGDRRKSRIISSVNCENVARTQAQTVADRTSQCSAVLADISNTLVDDDFLRALRQNVNVSATKSKTMKKKMISPEKLAQNWSIGIEAAKRTVEVTTQRGVRTVSNPALSRRFRTNDRQLRYRRLRGTMFSDTMESSVISKRGNRYAQVFGMPIGWTRAYPMKKKSEAHEGLGLLFARDGVPDTMVMDNAKEQVMGEFRRKSREAGCHIRQTEPYSPWANAAEGSIKELKKGVARKMISSKAPKPLWDDCLELESFIRSHTAHDIFGLKGEVPETVVSGETADISEFAEFKWYQWIKFRDTVIPFPEDKLVLGRYLGPSTDIGPAMTAKILKSNGQYVHRTTLRALTDDEIASPDELRERTEWDDAIRAKLGPGSTMDDFKDDDVETPTYDLYADEEDGEAQHMPERDDVTAENLDQYIGAEVLLPLGDKMLSGKVRARKRDRDGSLRGTAHSNPILDSRTYDVEFPDGAEAEYSANVIAENMWSQCDLEGNQYLLLDSIVDHRSDGHAVTRSDMYTYVNGTKRMRKTTKGWHFCIQWKDGTTTWERLSDLKESNPVQVAEYVMTKELDHEPAFAWWVEFTLKKRERIIAAVNQRYQKRTHKFGVRIPKSVKEAIAVDTENGDRQWQDAIDLEMNAVRVAFKILNGDESIPPGYQQIRCHMVFDVKMESFKRKARYVAGGHTTDAPSSITYASVVSRESVRIALTLAALNDLEVKTSDIKNAYLTAPVTEKIWTVCGPEFGPDAGKKAIIVRALYGLKSAGAAFRNHLAACMRDLGYTSCVADPDVWMKAEVRPSDGVHYWSYVLLYVDDCMAIHHDAQACLERIDKFFMMKKGSIGDPDLYLGAKLRKIILPNRVEAWSLSPSKYVQEAVKNVQEYLAREQEGRKLEKKAPTPFVKDYRPELDITPELGPEEASYYQSQIGVLRWMVELGRIDIITEVSLLASQLAMPRSGHLEAVFRIYAYLDKKHNSRMVFDPTYPEVDMGSFKECDWKEFYGDVKEAVPPHAPTPRGKEVDLRLFVDSDHAGDRLTRRSRTGYFIFMNMAPVDWYSKKQGTIESSVFGAEFVAMKTAMEVLRGLRYKLRMMGVPISGPTYAYGDNMSVIYNTQRPESTLKKKSNSICYHAIRESVAMGEMLTAHVPTAVNPADICTKVLSGGAKRDGLIGLVLYDLADEFD